MDLREPRCSSSAGRLSLATAVGNIATLRNLLVPLFTLLTVGCGSAGTGPSPPPDGGLKDVAARDVERRTDSGKAEDGAAYATPPKSCAFTCPITTPCNSPYVCPALSEWTKLPHESACPAWDGKTLHATPSKCTVSAPSGEAVKRAGSDPSDVTTTVLPDGRRVKAAGSEWMFDEPNLAPGLPMSVTPVPGTSYVLVVDAGYGPHSVRCVDTTLVGSGSNPVTSYVEFDAPEALNWPLAFVPPGLVLVATDDGVVQAITLDTTTGQLTRADARSITLPMSIDDVGNPGPYYVGGLSVSADSSKLVVSSVFDPNALVFDLTTANYGKSLGSVRVGGAPSFAAAFDPNDATGQAAYVALAGSNTVVEIDLSTPGSPKVASTFKTDKNPQAVAFLDGRWMVIANDFGDSFTLVDRVAATSTSVPVDVATKLHGLEPTSLAYDATNGVLYATLAALDAVGAWSVDTSKTPPAVVPTGRLPTSWWPAGVAVLAGGGLAVTTMRGHGDGTLDSQYPVGEGDAMSGVHGGIQVLPFPTPGDLSSGGAVVAAGFDVGAQAGAAKVTCPGGVEDDFPVPETNTLGPSKKIDHIYLVVRENKTFDALLGDLPTVDGDPSLTMKKTTADMDKLWKNFRDLVRQFATSDNYYTSAELSIQGHTWTTFGRTSDFTERTWALTGYSRNTWDSQVQPQGVASYGSPVEGSAFQWLIESKVPTDILGEAEGSPSAEDPSHPSIDFSYPGGFIQSLGYPDNEKSCYVAARERVFCNLGKFTYMTLPNDHTLGVSPAQASPEAMVAVNDEATGMLVDAVSHSPQWATSLIFVTEDDPAGGGDHVEHHRTPVLVASPWVKRGYVSETHWDIASIHKIVAHVFGLPYPNAIVASAALPLDLFTPTPDFTPYSYTPRQWPLSCGEAATLAERRLTETWDFSDVDRQPGLAAQVWRWMRGEGRQH